MMKHSCSKSKMASVLAVLGLVFTGGAQADIKSSAATVAKYRGAMNNPKTPLEQWQADQWLFLAAECSLAAGIPKPVGLKDAKIFRAGSYRAPKSIEKTCEALTSGPSVQCHGFNVREGKFSMPFGGFPSNYVFISSSKNLPKEAEEVSVGGYCDLVKNKIETRQFYAGPSVVRWVQQPKLTTLNTPTGTKQALVGTLVFEVQGVAGMPSMVILGN